MSLGLLVFVLGNRKISVRCCTFSSGLLLMYFLVSYLHFQALHFPLKIVAASWERGSSLKSAFPHIHFISAHLSPF